MIKVAVVDDHPIVVEGLVEFLNRNPDLMVVHTARNGEEILDRLQSEHVDVVVMDINMPVRDGISSTKLIKARFPRTKVIVFTMYNDRSYLSELVKAGADGCVLKTKGNEDLILAIEKVALNEKHFKIDDEPVPAESRLSDREKEIVRLLLEGIKTKEIAERLHISELTVRTHQKNVYRKVQVNNISELATYALSHSLLK